LRGLLVPGSKAICGRDGFTRDFGRSRHENLSGAISWLTFSWAEQLTPGEAKGIGGGNSQKWRLFLAEVEEPSLFSLRTVIRLNTDRRHLDALDLRPESE
jgi:hypothetical protein